MHAKLIEEAEGAFDLLGECDHGVRIDVLGLGTFTFHRYGSTHATSRLLPGGGVCWTDEATKVLVIGFVRTLREIQSRLEKSNGV